MTAVKDDTNRELQHALGLEESTLWKWLYHPKQSTASVQSLSNTNGIFHRTRTKNLKMCMETQEIPNSQSNLEKEKQSWRNQPSWLYTKRYSKQIFIALGSFTCLPNTYRSGIYLAKFNISNMIMCIFIIIAFYDNDVAKETTPKFLKLITKNMNNILFSWTYFWKIMCRIILILFVYRNVYINYVYVSIYITSVYNYT